MTDVNEDWVDDVMDRDPRSAPIGIFTGGSFVLDSARVFCWFQSVDALTDRPARCKRQGSHRA